MAKQKSVYVCNGCGESFPRWMGRCTSCGEYNTIQETKEPDAKNAGRYKAWAETSSLVTLRDVQAQHHQRYRSGISELDRVLGGGLVKGSVVLLGGDPGIGKSTLLIQAMGSYARAGLRTLYATGEESTEQTRLRAERLGMADCDISLLAEIDLQRILACIEEEAPDVVVVDSIQTMYSSELNSSPGSVAQVRECAAQLTRVAKSRGVSLILVGHVTKDGALAGPRTLEHMVDAVLYFEGDPGDSFRVVRSIKNRYGSAMEMGVFSMTEAGLEEVSNPSSMFLTAHEEPVAGVGVFAALEGTRPILVEIQALAEQTAGPNPRRAAVGMEASRIQMLLAVLNKHAGVVAFDQNIYIKVVGGVRLTEPAADLCSLLAVFSSLVERPLPQKTVVIGEVGLAGEVRAVRDLDTRLKEAAKLGFTQAIVPAANSTKLAHPGLTITRVARVGQALAALRQLKDAA